MVLSPEQWDIATELVGKGMKRVQVMLENVLRFMCNYTHSEAL